MIILPGSSCPDFENVLKNASEEDSFQWCDHTLKDFSFLPRAFASSLLSFPIFVNHLYSLETPVSFFLCFTPWLTETEWELEVVV